MAYISIWQVTTLANGLDIYLSYPLKCRNILQEVDGLFSPLNSKAAGYCHCLHLSVCLPVHPSVCPSVWPSLSACNWTNMFQIFLKLGCNILQVKILEFFFVYTGNHPTKKYFHLIQVWIQLSSIFFKGGWLHHNKVLHIPKKPSCLVWKMSLWSGWYERRHKNQIWNSIEFLLVWL